MRNFHVKNTNLIFCVFFALVVAMNTSFFAFITFLTVFLFFVAPGLPIASTFFAAKTTKDKICIGAAFGIPASITLSIILSLFFGFQPLLFLFGAGGLALVLFWATSFAEKVPQVKYRGDDGLYYLLLSGLLLVVLFSFTNFGKVTPDGIMFKDLYGTDLLHHMSVLGFLPYGIPPDNPYFAGVPWRYYWFSHVFPATVFAISGGGVQPREVLLLQLCLNIFLFYNVLAMLLKAVFGERKVVLTLLFISVIAYGYNDLFFIFKKMAALLPPVLVTKANLNYFIQDSYGGNFSGYSHGWFRNFIIEPHSTFALILSFLLLYLGHTRSESHNIVKVVSGFILAFIFACDAFIGVIVLTSTLISYAASIPKDELITFRSVTGAFSLLVPVIMMTGLLYTCRVIAPHGSHLTIAPATKMLLLSPAYLLIDYGPQLLFSTAGLFTLRSFSLRDRGATPLIILLVVSLFFMFFVNLSDIGTTQMFRKAGMVLRIPLLVLSGIFLQRFFKAPQSITARAGVFAMILVAVPTPFIDVYRLGSYCAASVIPLEDYKASQWVSRNTPHSAIIQDFPGATTPFFAFGHRRVALGDWEHAKSSGIVPKEIEIRHEMIRRVFSSQAVEESWRLCRLLGIDYLYVNERSKQFFGPLGQSFSDPNRFDPVYSGNGVVLYRVAGR